MEMSHKSERTSDLEIQNEKIETTSNEKTSRSSLSPPELTSKDLWNLFTLNSTLHGVIRCFDNRASYRRRLVWFVFCIALWSVLSWKVSTSISNFLDHQYNTRVVLEPSQSETIFPAVTICGINFARTSEINGSKLDKVIKETFRGKKIVNTDGMTYNRSWLHQASEMIYECTWKKHISCDHKNFSKSFMNLEMELCFTFNSPNDDKQPLTVHKTGIESGLVLTINVDVEDYYWDMYRSAVKVYVHEAGDQPIHSGAPIYARPGHTTYIEMQKTEIHRLSKPFKSACEEPQLEFFKTYSRTKCYIESLTLSTHARCGCKDWYLPGDNIPVCNVTMLQDCLWKYWASNDSAGIFTKGCPVTCTSTVYESTVSYASFPSNSYADEWAKRLTLNGTVEQNRRFLRKNFLEVNIYFGSLDFYNSTEIAIYDAKSLLCDIGGQLGLFVGASVLTFLEFLDVLVVLFVNYCQRYMHSKQRKLQGYESPSQEIEENNMYVECRETAL